MGEQSSRTDECLEAVALYSNMVYRLAVSQMKNKSDADDVFQEVFFRYIRKKPELESEEHRKAWFIRVTVNCCKNMFASAWRKKVVPLDETFRFETKEDNDIFAELQKLPPKYLAVIHLFYYEEMSIAEISQALKRNPSTVKSQLSRARKMLKDILGEEDSYVYGNL